MHAITILSQNIPQSKIGLVAVPPSKVDKDSPIRESIRIIKEWYDDGLAEDKFGGDKQIYDYGLLIRRISDISTAHAGKPATKAERKRAVKEVINMITIL